MTFFFFLCGSAFITVFFSGLDSEIVPQAIVIEEHLLGCDKAMSPGVTERKRKKKRMT